MRRIALLAVSCLLALVNGGVARAEVTPPSITSGASSAITAEDATLEAEIDPGSSKAGAYYQFQISEFPTEFPDELACPPPPASGPHIACIGPQSAAALPIGLVPAGAPGEVSLDLAAAGMNLNPGTTYYFRGVAAPAAVSEDTIEWEQPVVSGGEGTFTTLAKPVSPAPGSPSAAAEATAEASAEPAPLGRHRHHIHRRFRLGALEIAQARVARWR